MNRLLFDRSTGRLGPHAFFRWYMTNLLHDIQPATHLFFDGSPTALTPVESVGLTSRHLRPDDPEIWAHQGGVNALAIEPFESRFLITGGSSVSIKIWDLDQPSNQGKRQIIKPIATAARTDDAHKFGITHLSFYPFDSGAFLSSSYDHCLKLYSTESLEVQASFNLNSIIYTHSLSPIASHLLVSCATQHPAIRLVDLRSGSSAQSLAGHQGAVLSLAWSPTNEHILASGGTDGTVRLWDIRKSVGTLGLLDLEDSIGLGGRDGKGTGARPRYIGQAHNSAVNALTWTDDGAYIVTGGQDLRIRVWDASTGANTLASFGPLLKNSHLSTLPLLTTPTAATPPHKELLIYPNEREVLIFELHEGKLRQRLRVPGPSVATARASRNAERHVRNRITSLAWRSVTGGFYSGHSDGRVRVWMPRQDGMEDDEDDLEADRVEQEDRKRKREVLDDVFKDLTRAKITFG